MTVTARSFDIPVTAPWTASPQAVARPDQAVVQPVATPVAFEVVTDRAGFDALESDWNDLFDRAGTGIHVFQTFAWNWHWANHFLEADTSKLTLAIVVGRRDGRVVTIWPMVRQRTSGLTQIAWMGDPVSQYGDVLVDNIDDAQDVLRAAWTFLKDNVSSDLIRLRRVRADATIAPLLSELGAQVTERQIAPYMDLTTAKSFDDYEQRQTARSRRNRRRLSRRLAEQGGMEFLRYAGGKDARAMALKAVALKTEWLKDRGLVSNAMSDPRTAMFFADAAEGAEKSTSCTVSILMSKGEAAALEVSFLCNGRLVMHVIVFNLAFEKAGVGVLRLEQSLRDGFDDGLQIFDMLAPGAAYKLEWADGSTEVWDWAVPQSIVGSIYARLYLGFLRTRIKSALTAMPMSMRRAVTSSYAFLIALV